jgi:hypothetical protein
MYETEGGNTTKIHDNGTLIVGRADAGNASADILAALARIEQRLIVLEELARGYHPPTRNQDWDEEFDDQVKRVRPKEIDDFVQRVRDIPYTPSPRIRANFYPIQEELMRYGEHTGGQNGYK